MNNPSINNENDNKIKANIINKQNLKNSSNNSKVNINNNIIKNEIIRDNNLKPKTTFEKLKQLQKLIHKYSCQMEICI